MVQALESMLRPIPSMAAAVYGALLSGKAEETSWLVMLLFLGLHLGLSGLGGLFYWYHIQRLRRAKFFPATHWIIGIGVMLLVLAVVFPATLLPMADFARLPGAVPLDAVYLAFLPLALRDCGSTWELWGCLGPYWWPCRGSWAAGNHRACW